MTFTVSGRIWPLFLLLFGMPCMAQAPVITPAGDPSVKSDTIYKLAVKPADHPNEQAVRLLDDGVIRLEKDATGSHTYRSVYQLLKKEAIAAFSELTFSYDPDREEFVLNWARVLDLNGNVIGEKPIQVQESDMPASAQAPVYSNRKVVRVALGNVAESTIIDYSFTTRTKQPVLKGDFYTTWAITTDGTVRRSRLILDVPDDWAPRIKGRNVAAPTATQNIAGRTIRTWAYADIPAVEPEVFASDSNDIHQWLAISGPVQWADIAHWYASLAEGRYKLTPQLETKLAALVRGARTRVDSLRAVHRWVAQDIRYLSIALGQGGYQPRMPADVLGTTSGDCKDKATLFIALARRLGFEAYPVLLSAAGAVDRDVPTISQFDHAIAAVKLNDKWAYFDLTADLVPFGEVPPAAVDEFVLLVMDDGKAVELQTPKVPAGHNRSTTTLKGYLNGNGNFVGKFTSEHTGLLQYTLRAQFAQEYTAKMKHELVQAMAGSIFPGAAGDSLAMFDGRNLTAPVKLSFSLAASNVLQKVGNNWIMKLPLDSYAAPDLVQQLASQGRRFPFDVGLLFGSRIASVELNIQLPEGWIADLPKDIRAESKFGTYETTYSQKGRQLTISRSMKGAEGGVLPPTAKTELVDWLRKIGEDNAEFLVLQPKR